MLSHSPFQLIYAQITAYPALQSFDLRRQAPEVDEASACAWL